MTSRYAAAPSLTIAFVTTEYPPDPFSSGIGTYTKTLAEALAARGHRVFVVSRASADAPSRCVEARVAVLRVGPWRPPFPTRMSRSATLALALRGVWGEIRYRRNVADEIDRLIREEGVQLVEAADHAAEAFLVLPMKHPTVPLIVRLHTPLAVGELFDRIVPELARRIILAVERNFFERATHLSSVSDRSTRVILAEMGLPHRPYVTIPNLPSFDPLEVAVADDTGVDPDMVLYVGRINRWKGVHLLMQAMTSVFRRRPRTRLVLVGDAAFAVPGYASMTQYLMSLVPAEHRHAIEFTGRIPHPQVGDLMRRACVCVFPSLFEAFGYTCVEAMALGKAIVASDHGGMAELLDEGRCGLLFSPPDVDRLGGHVLRLLEEPQTRIRLGTLARDRVMTTYARDGILERTERYYLQAMADVRANEVP